jgi:hypothetical protein
LANRSNRVRVSGHWENAAFSCLLGAAPRSNKLIRLKTASDRPLNEQQFGSVLLP